MQPEQLFEIDVEYKENVEVYPGFKIDAYRPVKKIDRDIYGEFWVSPTSASRLAGYEEGWLGVVLAPGRKGKKTLGLLSGLGFSTWQVKVKVINNPKHTNPKPIPLATLPPILQYASIYAESIEQRIHASALLMAGNLESLNYRFRRAWGIEATEEQKDQEFAQAYSHYKKAFEALSDSYPVVARKWIDQQGEQLKISAPLSSYYHTVKGITHKLKKKYPEGIIKGKTLANIRNNIALLSTYISSWQKVSRKELRIKLGTQEIGKYPDLSFIIPINIDGKGEFCLFMLEFCDKFVDHRFVERMLGRRYLQAAKNALGVSHTFQMFVSPLGATPLAKEYIQRLLMIEEKGKVGVLTVKELVEALQGQALSAVRQGNVRGEINSICSRLSYEVPMTLDDLLFSRDCSQPSPEAKAVQLSLF